MPHHLHAASKRSILCRSHPDAHMPPELDIAGGFDGDAYARRMKDSGADLAVAFAKCHYGYAYYPTKVGTVHPRLKSNLLADTVAGLHRQGLAACGYVSVLIDGQAAAQHPEWLLKGDPKTSAGFDSGRFPRICVNSGYADEHFIPQCCEVVRDYPVDELLLDTMPGFSPCYCSVCEAKFGRPIPVGPQDPDWLPYARWYADCFDQFYVRASAAIHQVRDIPILWNWRWTWNEPEMPNVSGIRLAADAIASPGNASLHCRYFAGTGESFDYMCGRFAHGLAEWNTNYQPSLDLTAAEAVAHGGSYWLIDRQLPNGDLEERAWAAMKRTFTPIQERRQWLEATEQVYETAVLFSLDHALAPDRRHFPEASKRKERCRPMEGAIGFLAEHGRLACAMPRERLLAQLPQLRLVILPDCSYLDDDLIDAIEAWVAKGGRVLATMPLDGPTDALCRLAGVSNAGIIDTAHAYVCGEVCDEPLLMAKPWSRLVPQTGTQSLQSLHLPLLSAFGHGIAPIGRSADCPAATLRSHGQGQVLLVATTAFSAWWMSASPGLETALLYWLGRLLPNPIARIEHPGQVELSLLRQNTDAILHVINRCGRTRLAGWHYPMSRFVPDLRDVPLYIRASRPPQLTLEPGGIPLAVIHKGDDQYRATIPHLHTWQVIVSHDHFATT